MMHRVPSQLFYERMDAGSAGVMDWHAVAAIVDSTMSGSDGDADRPSAIQVGPVDPSARGDGLQNEGNTCFLNATLQCLLRVGDFTTWLHQHAAGGVGRACQ